MTVDVAIGVSCIVYCRRKEPVEGALDIIVPPLPPLSRVSSTCGSLLDDTSVVIRRQTSL